MIARKKILFTILLFLSIALPGCGPSAGEGTAPSNALTSTDPTQPPAIAPTSTPVPLPPSDTPEPSPTPWLELSGSGGGVIAFVSERSGSPVIYLMNADGSDQRQLTNQYDVHPDWSPDGQTLAFGTHRETIGSIYLYDMKTHSERQLTFTDRTTSAPDWAPGGTRLSFIYTPTHPGINYEIFLMNSSGESFKRLTDSTEYQHYANPDWSPDGRQIAYSADIDDVYNIYKMDPDGTNIVQLTAGERNNNKPAWSPDGSKIAFETNRDGNWEIYVMNADGSNLMRITDHPDDDKWPSWSPDGSRIAFQSDRDGNWEIYLMNAEGSDPIRLTENKAKDSEPAWKPVN